MSAQESMLSKRNTNARNRNAVEYMRSLRKVGGLELEIPSFQLSIFLLIQLLQNHWNRDWRASGTDIGRLCSCKIREREMVQAPFYAVVDLHGWQPSGTTYLKFKKKRGLNIVSCLEKLYVNSCQRNPRPQLPSILVPKMGCTSLIYPKTLDW